MPKTIFLDGCFKSNLVLQITGEEVYVQLRAEAINEPINFTPLDAEFGDTYMGLKAKTMITIRNESETKLTFKWKKFISPSAAGVFPE
jgi:hypothetical protein